MENIKEIQERWPEAIVEIEDEKMVELEKLVPKLIEEVMDLQDEMHEKDFQIQRLFELVDNLKR